VSTTEIDHLWLAADQLEFGWKLVHCASHGVLTELAVCFMLNTCTTLQWQLAILQAVSGRCWPSKAIANMIDHCS
jgi:hypothetical protein